MALASFPGSSYVFARVSHIFVRYACTTRNVLVLGVALSFGGAAADHSVEHPAFLVVYMVMYCISMHKSAVQVEGNVAACLGFLQNASCYTQTAVLRDVLVEGGVAMMGAMLNQCIELSASALLQFTVRFDTCSIGQPQHLHKLRCYVFHLCMQRELKEARGVRVLADLYMAYPCHGRSMADAWAAFVAASHTRTYQIFDAKLTSPERVTASLMQCIGDSLQTGFSIREDVQYFFKRCFGRILKDFEVFDAAVWSGPMGNTDVRSNAYLQGIEHKWLSHFTSLICEPVMPIIASASLEAVTCMHSHTSSWPAFQNFQVQT